MQELYEAVIRILKEGSDIVVATQGAYTKALERETELQEAILYLWQRFLDIYTEPGPPEWQSYTAEQITEWCKADKLAWGIWQKNMDKIEAEFPI